MNWAPEDAPGCHLLPSAGGDAPIACVTTISTDRAVWLARHVLPHEGALRAWLRGKRNFPFEADDLVQEAYAVLASMESVEHIRNPKTYLFQTAYSLALRQLRHARVVSIRSVADIDRLDVAFDAPSPERQVSDREELQRLADAMSDLPPQCGEAFRLRKVEGLSQREIASEMGIAESTVEKHIGKALRLLMIKLGGSEPAMGSGRRGAKAPAGSHGETRDKR